MTKLPNVGFDITIARLHGAANRYFSKCAKIYTCFCVLVRLKKCHGKRGGIGQT